MPALANATISFRTNNEDKDDDTHVTVDVHDLLAAHVDNDFGHFDDHSDNGPFALIIWNPNEKADLQRGSVKIRIDPNGHDTWRFNFDLDLHFEDGSRLSGGARGLELTQEARAALGLDGMLRSWAS